MDVEDLGGTPNVDLTKHPSGVIPIVHNVVATVNLCCKLDLKSIVLQVRNAEYNPKRFGAVIMKIREPKATALIFASGKMVCMGARSEDAAKLAARKFARIIQKVQPQKVASSLDFRDFQIRNVVASCDVKFPIRLEGLAFFCNRFCTYEPELFPGLIYRHKINRADKSDHDKGKKTDHKVCLLIFVSGKIVLTGAKDREEIYKAFEDVYPAIRLFRKGQDLEECLQHAESISSKYRQTTVDTDNIEGSGNADNIDDTYNVDGTDDTENIDSCVR